MKKTSKIILVPLLLVIISFNSNVKMTCLSTMEVDEPNEVLVFLEEVVKLDLSKYNIELAGTTVSYPLELNGLPQTTGKYILHSTTSNITVLFKFRNHTLSWCLLRSNNDSPKFSIQVNDSVFDKTKAFLDRYQTFTEDSSVEAMKNMLDSIDTTKNTTKTTNEIKVSVENTAESTCFEWIQTINGAEYAGMSISFKNGTFYSLSDKRSIYSTGDTEVNITKQEAISLSLKYAENLTWTIGDEKVTEFNIQEEMIDPKLFTRGRDEPLKLYPYWYVLLYLDDTYPGNVRHIQVMLWADTGKPIDCQPISFGGMAPQDDVNADDKQLTNGQITISSSEQNIATLNAVDVGIIALSIIIIVITSIILIFKRKKVKY